MIAIVSSILFWNFRPTNCKDKTENYIGIFLHFGKNCLITNNM